MKSFTRRGMLGGLTIAASIGAMAPAAFAQLQAEIYVPTAPPPPRREVIPVLPPDRVEIEHWQPGYWRWNGHEYVWAEGRYVARPRRGAAWVPGRWEQRPRGWVYIEGHWG
jgi:WXXGXW repeat (2 copies)